jgi:hypothetical protein
MRGRKCATSGGRSTLICSRPIVTRHPRLFAFLPFCHFVRGILSHSDSLVSATEAQSVVLIGGAVDFLTLGVPRVYVALRRSGSAYL